MWDKIIDGITAVNGFINNIVWGWPVIILILGTGLLLTILTKFLQLRKFGDSFNSTIVATFKSAGKGKKKDTSAKSVSQFEAFATAISGTVGTGNIVGVVAAILSGGPGAVFWMWISAFFGMVTNYSENLLGLYYRKKDEDGNFCGGAFYYAKNGLKGPAGTIIGYCAAAFASLAAIGMSGAQTNKISSTIALAFGRDDTTAKLIVGIVLAVIVAIIILGGIKRISRVAALLVPFMSVLFMILALITIFTHVANIPVAFVLIFKNAFGFKAALGGFSGYLFSVVIKKGMARGVFSNEAGLGSSVIAHSASATREPVKQGLWGIFEVFFDTFVVCTLTALMMLTTLGDGLTERVSQYAAGGLDDTAQAMGIFTDNFGLFGKITFAVILPLFAFTTIMAWSYYGEKAVEFIFRNLSRKGRKISTTVFKVVYVIMIVVASVITSTLAWDISDTFNGLMAIPNLISLVFLSTTVAKVTKNYYDRKKGLDVEPMLSAYPDMNEEFKADIATGNEELE